MRLSHAIGVVALSAMLGLPARADDRPTVEPPQSLTTFTIWLRDPDREKRYQATVGIRDFYKNQCADIVPLLLDTYAEELDVPRHLPDFMPGGRGVWLRNELWRTIREVTPRPELVKLAKEFTQHRHPLRRAAGLQWWGHAAGYEDAKVDADELLGAVREGLKDPNRVVRTYAVGALFGLGNFIPRALDTEGRRTKNYPPRVAAEAVRLLIPVLDDFPPPRPGFPEHDDNPAIEASGILTLYMPQAKQAIPALSRQTTHPDWYMAACACRHLCRLAELDPSVWPEVLETVRPVIRDKRRSDELRCRVIFNVYKKKPAAHELIPDLVGILDDKDSTEFLRRVAGDVLGGIHPVPEALIPAIIRWLEETKAEESALRALKSLRRIGPAAAAPLAAWRKTTARTEAQVLDEAETALKAIQDGQNDSEKK